MAGGSHEKNHVSRVYEDKVPRRKGTPLTPTHPDTSTQTHTNTVTRTHTRLAGTFVVVFIVTNIVHSSH